MACSDELSTNGGDSVRTLSLTSFSLALRASTLAAKAIVKSACTAGRVESVVDNGAVGI